MAMTSAIRAVALDLDGTLAGADHRVSERSAKVLAALQRRGILPILVTGRLETETLRICAASQLTAPAVSCNGAVITDPGSRERLFISPMNAEMIGRVLQFAANYHLQPILWSATKMFASHPTEATVMLEAINRETFVMTSLDTVDRNEIVKIILSGERERLDAVQSQLAASLPQFKRSMDVFYEACNEGVTKWEALSLVLDRLGIAPGECMGIADGDTDIGWLSKIGLPVAVENARPAVRAVASLQIGHHADDAVAQFLQDDFKLPAE
ncbi:MAG: HAD family hydrolase [Terracidiphilus sp.]